MKISKLVERKAKSYDVGVVSSTRNDYGVRFKTYILSGFLCDITSFINDDEISKCYEKVPGTDSAICARHR